MYALNQVKGMPFKSDEGIKALCATCLKGRQSRNYFPKHEAPSVTELLEIINSDDGRPMVSKSLGGNAYCVAYFIRNKREMFKTF